MTSPSCPDDVPAEQVDLDITELAACGVANDYNIDVDDGYNVGPFAAPVSNSADLGQTADDSNQIKDDSLERYRLLQKQTEPVIVNS